MEVGTKPIADAHVNFQYVHVHVFSEIISSIFSVDIISKFTIYSLKPNVTFCECF